VGWPLGVQSPGWSSARCRGLEAHPKLLVFVLDVLLVLDLRREEHRLRVIWAHPLQAFQRLCEWQLRWHYERSSLFFPLIAISSFSYIVSLTADSSDPSGALNFNGKAILHAQGVDFSSGASFSISMDQFELEDELGKGNYGTVRKVIHKPTKVNMAMKVGHSFHVRNV
jgi:hypothetical protein